MGTWFIPSPFSSCPTLGGRDFDTTVTAVRGVPDTTSRESERVSGSETGIIYVGTLDEISIIPEGLIGEREIIAGTEEGDTLQIRARTYLFYYERAQDSVDYYTETSIEWNLKPRPIEIITRIDTLKIEIPVPVKVPVPVPFIEQPAVVATITTAIIMGLIYGLREARK